LVNIGSEAKSCTCSPGYTFKSDRENSGECSSVFFDEQEATTISAKTSSILEVIEGMVRGIWEKKDTIH